MKGTRPLTPEEVETVLASFGNSFLGVRNRAIFTVGVNTGLRVSELISLRICDTYQNGDVLTRVQVRRCNVKGKTEGRIIRFNAKSRAAVQAWLDTLAVRKPEPLTPLFCTLHLKPISRFQVWRMLDKTFAKAGIVGVLGTHCMRKTFADRMYELLGRDLKQLQGALGHKWITSTSQYLSFKEDEIDCAIDAL